MFTLCQCFFGIEMQNETIAAIATGMTPSGIGIIRISGEDSFSIASKIYKTKGGKSISEFESHRVYYGFVYDEETVIDEILLIPMQAPKSFSGENTVELQCHGGVLVMKRILETVIKNGARPALPGEFTKRAFLNGRIDLSEAEAVMNLINAQNDLALQNSVKHLKGKLFEVITDIRSEILYETAFIESALDDPEHYSLDGYPENLKLKIESLISKLRKLSSSFMDGKILSEGVNTVILGRPNVGKSSLMNILSGSERSIVTDIAGTTRDVLEEKVMIEGILLNVVDTAGIHSSEDYVERIGINKALEYAKDADLIIMIVDSSVPFSEQDEEILTFIQTHKKQAVVLLNKTDLVSVVSADEIGCYTSSHVIQFSATTGQGLDELKSYIKDSYLTGMIKYNDEIFISNIRQKESLDNAINSLEQVIESINCSMPEDFFTIDLTNAYSFLGYIIGQETSEDVINEIFKKFCTGK